MAQVGRKATGRVIADGKLLAAISVWWQAYCRSEVTRTAKVKKLLTIEAMAQVLGHLDGQARSVWLGRQLALHEGAEVEPAPGITVRLDVVAISGNTKTWGLTPLTDHGHESNVESGETSESGESQARGIEDGATNRTLQPTSIAASDQRPLALSDSCAVWVGEPTWSGSEWFIEPVQRFGRPEGGRLVILSGDGPRAMDYTPRRRDRPTTLTGVDPDFLPPMPTGGLEDWIGVLCRSYLDEPLTDQLDFVFVDRLGNPGGVARKLVRTAGSFLSPGGYLVFRRDPSLEHDRVRLAHSLHA